MDCPFEVKTIVPTECIGNSLEKINGNFRDLKEDACSNYNRLSVIDSQIAVLNTQIDNLSAITVPGVLRAWVKFDGTKDTSNVVSPNLTNRLIYSAFNIGRVQTIAVGDYRIFFNTAFAAATYVAVGTSSQAIVNNTHTWLQPYDYRTAFLGVRVANANGTLVAANHVSVVFY